MKLIVDEPESRAPADAPASERRVVASWLVHTELHCASGRHPQEIPLADALRLRADEIATYNVSSQTLRTPPDSRSSPRRLMELLRPTEWCSVNDHVRRPCHVGRGRRTALRDRRHRRHTSKEVQT